MKFPVIPYRLQNVLLCVGRDVKPYSLTAPVIPLINCDRDL